MPQLCIPIFAEGVVCINPNLAYKKDNGRVYYFNGQEMPVFSHAETDYSSFRMIVSQFYVNGNATQSQIIKAFGIPSINIKRAVKTFRMHGPSGFYISFQPKRKPRVLTDEVVSEVQKLMDEGRDINEICEQFKIKKDTLQKAVRTSRLKKKIPHQKELFPQKARGPLKIVRLLWVLEPQIHWPVWLAVLEAWKLLNPALSRP